MHIFLINMYACVTCAEERTMAFNQEMKRKEDTFTRKWVKWGKKGLLHQM